ncbi:AAA family ATPase [Ectobacillus sp. sgz5001026]|uniref:AAA family ATPase n=1 Tax=Ectobacillus sp. sgz5001026 TaxID=3242473 RepID=UPI0036D2A9E4
MKPILLTMTAFGPYKYQENIDFTKLGEHRLFSISGNTGAGKTTIFDAICYALYGEASGEERNDVSMLRSHFADDDTYTFVSLTFEMHGKTYYIKRQMAHRKQGNKTATGGVVELYEVVDGENIPCVDRFHVNDVNKKLEELIGLTKHQFSQIVMLPQGEFRKLLTSETENKEEILRRIFKTNRYNQIRELLDHKRKQLKNKLEGKIQERDIYYRNALAMPVREESLLQELSQQSSWNSFQMIAALEEEQAFFNGQLQLLRNEESLQISQLRQKEKAYHEAKSINELFQQLEQTNIEYNNLIENQSYMKQKEEQLVQAEKANRIQPYEASCKEANRVVEQTNQVYKTVQIQKEQLDSAYKKVTLLFEEEKEKQTLREQRKQEWNVLQDMQSIVETWAERTTKIAALASHITKKSEMLHTYKQQYERAMQERKQISMQLQQLDEASQHFVTKQRELDTLRDDVKLLMKVEKALNESKKDESTLHEAKKEVNDANAAYEEIEKQYLSEQAGQIALHLHDGEPCPVCGSTLHPNLADQMIEVIDKHQMNEVRKRKEQAEKIYFRNDEKWKLSIKQYEEYAVEAKYRGYDISNFAVIFQSLTERGQQLSKDVKQLEENEKQRSSMRKLEKEKEQRIDTLVDKIKEVDSEIHTIQLQEMEQKLSLEHDRNTLPSAITSLEEWRSQCQIAKSKFEELEQSWHSVQQQFETIQKQAIQIGAEFDSLSRELERATVQKVEKQKLFDVQLIGAGFINMAAYETAKLTPEQVVSEKRNLQDYYSSVDVMKKQLVRLQQTLDGKEKSDLAELTQDITDIQQLVTSLIEQRQNVKRTIEDIIKLKGKIASIDEQIHDDEVIYQEIVDVYEVVKGDNENRISFERYVLIEYLEQIVHAANERLRKLSNGQFFLKRSDRVEKRNRQSGLGLDVYDAYTGQTRDVKTLSGGEKFNASLCLALGMADVIQSYEGGISIETMFIDEGFGSLDEESLMKAIDTLIDLQKSGRIIGVISHVQELKQALPVSLEVTKSKDGFSQTKFVIK